MKKLFISFLCLWSIGVANAMDNSTQDKLATYLLHCVKHNKSSEKALAGYVKLMENEPILAQDKASFHLQYQIVQMFYECLQKEMHILRHDKRKKIAKIKQ